uniref:Uncharacterized protein n=1 Tax=Cannabis sativa TaxID=3483 RepID=A0A803QY35_CANSA
MDGLITGALLCYNDDHTQAILNIHLTKQAQVKSKTKKKRKRKINHQGNDLLPLKPCCSGAGVEHHRRNHRSSLVVHELALR